MFGYLPLLTSGALSALPYGLPLYDTCDFVFLNSPLVFSIVYFFSLMFQPRSDFTRFFSQVNPSLKTCRHILPPRPYPPSYRSSFPYHQVVSFLSSPFRAYKRQPTALPSPSSGGVPHAFPLLTSFEYFMTDVAFKSVLAGAILADSFSRLFCELPPPLRLP